MLSAMERLAVLARGEIPDRTPIVCNLLEQGARQLGMSIREYYSKGEHVAEGQLRMRRRFGYDNLSGFHYTAKDAEMLGSTETVFADNGPPNVGDLIVKDARDIERLEIPEDIGQHPGFAEEAKTIGILRHEEGGRYPIVSTALASFSMPAILMGIDRWLDLLLTGPESLRRELLTKCSCFCARRVKALRKAGVDFVSYSNPVGTAAFINPAQFEELALEWVERDLSLAGAEGLVYFNGGGRLNPMLPILLERTQIGTYYVNPMDDVAEAKGLVGGKALLAAPINDIGLVGWSKEEIDSEVRRIMEAGAPGGGFAFGTLVMPCQIPEDNIVAMLEAAFRYGAYE